MKPEIRKIRTVVATTLFIVVLVLGLSQIESADAQTQPLLNFIGKVTNLDGTEIADGAYDFTFRLFVVPGGGSSIWSETSTAATRFSATVSLASPTANGMVYTYSGPSATSTLRVGQYLSSVSSSAGALIVDYNIGANTITVASSTETWSAGDSINNRPFVEGGIINENLGVITDISSVDFSQTTYLEIIFNGETMSPRKLLTTVPAAFDTTRLGGKTESEYATLSEDETITGEWSFNNIISVSTSSSNAALTVTQSGTGNIVEFKLGATTSFAVLNDGRVQIGDYRFPTAYGSPGYVLKTDASGDLYWDPDFVGGFGSSGLDFLWATNTAETLIRPVDTADIVVIGNIATSTFAGNIFEVDGSSLFDTVNISNQEELRLYDTDSSNYIALRATSSISSNLVLTLPDNYGALGMSLVTDGAGNLSWSAQSSFVYVNPGTIGQMAYYANAGSALAATSSIYLSDQGYFGIGTTTPSQLLSVGGTSGSQFLVNNSGQIVAGVWQGDILDTAYGGIGTSSTSWTGLAYVDSGVWSPTSTLQIGIGGTGLTSYSSGDIIYAGSAGALTRLGIGANGQILTAQAGQPSWTSTSSLGINVGDISGILGVNQGGTGQNFASATGFIYLDNGVAIASATIAIPLTNLQAASGIVLTNNLLTLDDSGDWGGTFDGEEGSYYLDARNLTNFIEPFASALVATTTDALAQGSVNLYYDTLLFAVDLAATTTDALSEGLVNLYWADARFDSRLTATTTLPNISTLTGLTEVGTIATGTWQGDAIDVAYGGTGLGSITNQSLLYASSDNIINEFTIGAEGTVLAVVSGQLSWATTSAPAAHSILSVSHSDAEATSTLIRGDLMVANSGDQWSRLGLGANGYILYSNGSDAIWSTTTVITALGIITSGTWQAGIVDIAYGGTNASTATGARINLGLDDVARFGVNSTGTDGWMWQSDGDGRGQWVATSSLGLGNGSGVVVKLIGTTTQEYNGAYATTSLVGYEAANTICAAEFSNSFMCRTYDILVSIEQDDISQWSGSAWIAEGPPGYTSNSNDCNGWTSSSTIMLGAFWALSSDGGGVGWLTNCSETKPISCCSSQ